MIRFLSRKLDTPVTVVALATARMTGALGNSLLIILLPVYIASMPTSSLPMPRELLVGVMISAFGVVMTILQPLAGMWSDRIDRRKPFILVGLALMSVATLGFIGVQDAMAVVVLRAIQGVAVAIIVVPSLALISSSVDMSRRGAAMGVYDTMRMIGFSGGPLLGGAILVTFGFTAAFVVGAAFSAVAVVLVLLTVVEEKTTALQRKAAADAENLSKTVAAPVFMGMLALGVGQCVMAIGFSALTTLENVFNERLDQTALGFGVAFAALTIARFVVQIPLGRLADRRGRKRLILGGQIALGVLLLGVGQAASSWQLVILTASMGVATGCIAAPSFALAGDLARSGGVGKQMSVLTVGFASGLAIGPILSGALVETVGFESTFYVVGAACFGVAVFTGLFVRETVSVDVGGQVDQVDE